MILDLFVSISLYHTFFCPSNLERRQTKGSSIQNVIVVIDEFFWNEYNFSSLYMPESDSNANRIINSKKLIYVACSRAMAGLVCVKVLTADEVESFKRIFPCAEQI